MKPEWQDLLLHLQDGEDLSEAEAKELSDALATEEVRKEAMRWLGFHALLGGHFAAADGKEKMVLSRERLLAEAILRAKEISRRRAVRRKAIVGWSVAAAAALLLFVGGWWLWPGRRYPGPGVTGDCRIVRAGAEVGGTGDVRRGDTLTAGPGGADVRLGGYCALRLSAGAEIVIQGEPSREAVELVWGRVASTVDPGRGQFGIQTARGRIEVKGTEFVTWVEPAGVPEGKTGSSTSPHTLRASTVVTVAVAIGVVDCHFGERVETLGPGQHRIFAEEAAEGKTEGKVDTVSETEVALTSAAGQVTLAVLAKPCRAHRGAMDLSPGDPVTATWVVRKGRKWVKDFEGKGTVVGVVTNLGDRWIEVTPQGGRALKYHAVWVSGPRSNGEKFNPHVLELIRRQKIGTKVELSWILMEGKRVVHIRPAEETQPRPSP